MYIAMQWSWLLLLLEYMRSKLYCYGMELAAAFVHFHTHTHAHTESRMEIYCTENVTTPTEKDGHVEGRQTKSCRSE